MAISISWDSNLYQQSHAFVYQYGEGLLELLLPQSGEKILDLGCGTGELTESIYQQGADVLGIDSAAEMIAKAKQLYPAIPFEVQDGHHFSYSNAFDAIFSNAALHWMTQPEKVIQNIYQSLKPGGRLVAEFGGKGNIQSIQKVLKEQLLQAGYPENAATQVWYFPSTGEYASLLEAAGFTVRLAQWYERETVLQDTKEGIVQWIQMFCGAYLSNIPAARQQEIATATQATLKATHYRDHQWYADYRRLRIMATKPVMKEDSA